MLGTILGAAVLAPATFAPAPGWHVGTGHTHACPGIPAARCSYVASWAATVRWRDCAECLPHRTVARLGADGIALQLQIATDRDPPKWMKPLSWPPRLGTVVAPFEGLPARIGVSQTYGLRRGHTISLFTFFGRAHPTPRQFARAVAELKTVTFPRR